MLHVCVCVCVLYETFETLLIDIVVKQEKEKKIGNVTKFNVMRFLTLTRLDCRFGKIEIPKIIRYITQSYIKHLIVAT